MAKNASCYWWTKPEPPREERLCEHYGGYKAINRIPLPLNPLVTELYHGGRSNPLAEGGGSD